MRLYSFFNSSTSYRVRIALALKGITYETLPINIRSGEHHQPHYFETVNPASAVPTLKDGDLKLSQSLAIIDYLDELHPEPRLIPRDVRHRARVLEFAQLVACDIHPINNLRVLRRLATQFDASHEEQKVWYRHWISEGMRAAEALISQTPGPWCFGRDVTLADVCLVPQIANALRMGCQLDEYLRCQAVYRHACAHPAFDAAQPSRQPDFTQ
jgi:maleylacetoacetate isomerase